MTALTTDVTVTIHGSEMDLVAEGLEVLPAEAGVGMGPSIEGWGLYFLDGSPIPREWYDLLGERESEMVQRALDVALARGDFGPDPD